MPELPEVETVRRGLAPVMEGRRILSAEIRRANLRFAFPDRFTQRLTGRTITLLGRRAKYLLADLDDGEVLIMHLGMTGRFIIEMQGQISAPGEFAQEITRHTAHDHVVLQMEGGARITYNDVRRFGFMVLVPRADIETHLLTRDIGIEPLGNGLNADVLAVLFAGKATPLKAALLDQKLIAGLGNIYVCEALFRAKLSPLRAAGTITGPSPKALQQRELLVQVIRMVLEEAIEAGGSTLRDFAHADGSLGYFQHRFQVYDRAGEPCPNPACSGVVERIVQSGRSTFFCARCQR
jgi:formamidopyrimidine-DNA glycosylase